MNAIRPIRSLSRRRGIALVLVVLVMALAGIMAYAMLAAAAVQATASANAAAAAIARAQAESGIHLAMYYLLNPGNAPASFTPGGPPVTVKFATTQPSWTMPGTVTIQVGSPSNHCYSVVSTGSSDSSAGVNPVTRTITAEIQVGTPLQINQAGAFNYPITVGTYATFSSSNANAPAIASNGVVTNNGHINGNISATNVVENGTWTNGSLLSATLAPAPSTGNVTDYTQPYVYQGTLYNPVLIGSSISTVTSLGPTPSNPLGIYYTTGSLSVSKSLTINGTLVVGGTGSLTNTSSITITPLTSQPNTYLPALVVNNKLTMSGHSASLNATGVTYVANGITGSGTNSATNVTINGALLITNNAIATSYTGTASVTYNSTYTNIRNFDVNDWASNSSVKVIAWSE
jgi:Tfp pilus assembly protein PilX